MESVPTQCEIDAVAHFVEATRELRKSPFFLEEHRSLSISMAAGAKRDEIRAKFPDPEIVRGALVPFRRVWLQSEPCYHIKVANILKRYVPAYRAFLDSLLFTNKGSLVGQFEWFRDCGLSPTDVVDLWLNTRYHHVGMGKSGRFTREDFDRFNGALGPVPLEYYFLQSIHEIGVSLFNILQCAERFLETLSMSGNHPSFALVAVQDERVERVTPGYSPETNIPCQRVWRLRRRRDYDGINYLLEISGLSDNGVSELLNDCESFDDFAVACGMFFEPVEDFERATAASDVTHAGGCIDNQRTAMRNQRCRRGFVAKRKDGPFICAEDYLSVIRDQYLEFRKAFRAHPFE